MWPAPTLSLTIAVLVLSGISLLASPPAAAQSQGAAGVHVDSVREVPLTQSAPVIGRLVATQSGVVAARVAAPIEAFLVEVGDRVERGETMAVLDDEVLSAQRAQAAAALSEANAQLATREAQLALAQQELQRLERLRESAAFSQARYDDQRQQAAIAEAEIATARAAVQRARSDLEMTDIALRQSEVRAPYDGVVIERMAEVGAYADTGEPLLRMLSDRTLEIEADVPSRRLAGLHPGTVVAFTLEDESRHEAAVRAVLPQESATTRTRTVRLVPEFSERPQSLASGQSATVYVPVGEARDVLSVHKDAVLRQRGEANVYVYADGEAEMRSVELGMEIGERFEVLAGLEAGDLAVVRGNERLAPGDLIRIDQRRGPAAEDAGAAGGAPDGSASG